MYPGIYAPDSLRQLEQALDGQLVAWHPIAMAGLWRIFYLITGNINSFIILQLSLFSIGILIFSSFLWRKYKKPSTSLIPFIFYFLPNILFEISVFVKDVQLALSFFIVIGIILHLRLKNKLPLKIFLIIFAVVFLIYGDAVRANGYFAAIPLGILLIHTAGGFDLKIRNLKPFCAGIIISLLFSGFLLNAIKIVNSISHPIASDSSLTMFYLDLVNVATHEEIDKTEYLSDGDKTEFHTNLNSKLSQFNTSSPDLQFWNYKVDPEINIIDREVFGRNGTNRESIDKIHAFWFQEIIKHPKSYFKYKLYSASLFLSAHNYDLGIDFLGHGNTSTKIGTYNKLEIRMLPLHFYINYFLDVAPFQLLFNRLVYFIASFVLLFIALSRKNHKHPYREFIFAIAISSIFYYIPFFFGSLTPDYRFTYYNMFAVTFAIILLIIPKIASRKR